MRERQRVAFDKLRLSGSREMAFGKWPLVLSLWKDAFEMWP